MPRPQPGRTPVFHIVPIEKLGSIVEHGLNCDTVVHERFGARPCLSAAYPGLKTQRRMKSVPVAVGGVMADYVPFYFGPRSPMLYTIWRGNTAYGREGRGQAGMVHLVLRLEALAKDYPGRWCFIDAHLAREWSRFGDTLDELDERIDFATMRRRQWNTPDEVRARRQAECLVGHVVPWRYVELVVVIDDGVAAEVKDVMSRCGSPHVPEVRVRAPGLYEGAWFPYGYYYG